MNDLVIDRMKDMKLYGMLHAFRTSMDPDAPRQHTADELVEILITAEWDDRSNRRHERTV